MFCCLGRDKTPEEEPNNYFYTSNFMEDSHLPAENNDTEKKIIDRTINTTKKIYS